MHALILSSAVAAYPYGLDELRRDNPSTCFPSSMTASEFAQWNVYAVIPREAPACDPATQTCTEVTPTREGGVWVQTWSVTQASAEEIAERTDAQAAAVRAERNSLLAGSDWTQVLDAPVDREAWAAYRLLLREVPDQAGFPWSVTWPVAP